MQEIRIHGRGGQGVAAASRMLSSAFVKEGKWASGFPMFGVERRGAPVAAFARFDDRPIREKTQIYWPDCLIVADPRLIDSIRGVIFDGIRPDGILILNASRPIQESPHKNLKKVGTVDATGIGLQEIGLPATNTCMLGAFAQTTGWLRLESVIHGLTEYFDGDMLKKNIRCAERGFEEVVVKQF
jgi:2-oxoacid:acceptor oxidoreductase gamma subunit (pyruvate/2-ketoisovalerate family)